MRVLDTNPLAWSFAVPEGALPSSRGGHTVRQGWGWGFGIRRIAC
jgi:hypothetical protein